MDKLLNILGSDKCSDIDSTSILKQMASAMPEQESKIILSYGRVEIRVSSKLDVWIDGQLGTSILPDADTLARIERAMDNIHNTSMTKTPPPKRIKYPLRFVVQVHGSDELLDVTWIDSIGIYVRDYEEIDWRIDPKTIKIDESILNSYPAMVPIDVDGVKFHENLDLSISDAIRIIAKSDAVCPSIVPYCGGLYFKLIMTNCIYYEPVPGWCTGGLSRVTTVVKLGLPKEVKEPDIIIISESYT